jgi:hypothetical protein
MDHVSLEALCILCDPVHWAPSLPFLSICHLETWQAPGTVLEGRPIHSRSRSPSYTQMHKTTGEDQLGMCLLYLRKGGVEAAAIKDAESRNTAAGSRSKARGQSSVLTLPAPGSLVGPKIHPWSCAGTNTRHSLCDSMQAGSAGSSCNAGWLRGHWGLHESPRQPQDLGPGLQVHLEEHTSALAE